MNNILYKKPPLYKRKWVWLLFLLVILLAFVAKIYYFTDKKPQYMTAFAKRDDIELSVAASGMIKPQKLVAVGARTSGCITALNVHPGSLVKKGDILATIDSTNQENELKKAKAILAAYQAKLVELKAQLELNQGKMARTKKLLNSEAVMASAYNDIKAQLDITNAEIKFQQAEIEQAQIGVQNAQLALSYTKIIAPSDGMVLANLVQQGQNINAVQSVPTVVILGDITRMKVYAQISEADIANIKKGQEVYFNVMGNPNRIYHSVLEQLDPAPEIIRDDITFNGSYHSGSASAIYYNGIFSIDNKDNSLLTYMNCEAHIILAKAKNVILVPIVALRNYHNNHAEILVKNGEDVTRRQIVVGLNNKVMAEIKQGLKEGEEVVLSSDEDLSADGAASDKLNVKKIKHMV